MLTNQLLGSVTIGIFIEFIHDSLVCVQVSGMIHFAQAVRGLSDLGQLMIKQMGEALASGQPEAFTEAMFKLAALLISSKGFILLCACSYFDANTF